MKIGIDIDDVLMPTFLKLLGNHNATYGTSYKLEDTTDYKLWVVWGYTREEHKEEVNSFMATGEFFETEPYGEALEAVRKLKESHSLVTITSRPLLLKSKTLDWLEKHFSGIFDSFFFPEGSPVDETVGGKSKKVRVCADEGVDVIIEDAPQTAIDCAEVCKKVFLFDKPWNRNYDFPANVVRVTRWDEVLAGLGER